MRTRHRPPSFFNLSMVDILCCALGCMILLWLLNLREARQKSLQAGTTSEQLQATLAERDRALSRLATLERDLAVRQEELEKTLQLTAATQKKLSDTEDEVRKLTAALTQARGERDGERKNLADLGKEMERLRLERDDLTDKLTRGALAYSELDKKLSATSKMVVDLENRLREKETLAELTSRQAKDLAEKLTAAGDRGRTLQDDLKMLDKALTQKTEELAATRRTLENLEKVKSVLELDLKSRDKDLGDARAFKQRWELAESRIRELTSEIESRRKDAVEAGRRVEALQAEAVRFRTAAENRFEGITLTGRRVVFLVDMSGSMERIDRETPDATKWTGVRETLVKLLRSLPDVEKFQVLLFSEKVVYPLGQEGRWIDYDAKSSPERVNAAVAAVKPEGGTNMQIGLEATFAYRAQGLDTLYLLSDGLPNIGEGLPINAASLKEFERCEILSKHIRKKLKETWNRPQNGSRVKINTIGFFYESPDVGAFLWAMARENEGSFVGMSRP